MTNELLAETCLILNKALKIEPTKLNRTSTTAILQSVHEAQEKARVLVVDL